MNLIESDVSVLERSCAIYMLLLISEHEGLSKKRLTNMGESYNERTKNDRIAELIDAGLVEYRRGELKYNAGAVYLTEDGKELVKSLVKVRNILKKIQKQQKSENATGTDE